MKGMKNVNRIQKTFNSDTFYVFKFARYKAHQNLATTFISSPYSFGAFPKIIRYATTIHLQGNFYGKALPLFPDDSFGIDVSISKDLGLESSKFLDITFR